MKTKLTYLWSIIFIMLLGSTAAYSQAELPKFELGAQFSFMSLNDPDLLRSHPIAPGFIGVLPGTGRRNEPGFGGRFTYNLDQHFAIEAEGNLFPRSESRFNKPSGRIFQGQFGLKVGKRFRKFGLFAKVRPGFVAFTEVTRLLSATTTAPAGPLNETFTVGTFGRGAKAYLSADIGGVVEYYFGGKVFARFDVGDTIIRYSEFSGPGAFLSRAIITRPAQTKHNLQTNIGAGFRF